MLASPGDRAHPRRPVLFVALQTGAAANGGIASLDQIVRRLTRFRPVMVTNRDSEVTSRWRASGVEVHVVREGASQGWRRAPAASLAAYLRYFRAIRTLLAGTGASIVHANDPLAFQLALAPVRTRPGTALALSIRDTLDPNRRAPRIRYDRLFGTADHTFFLSRDMAARWGELAPRMVANSSATYSIVDFARFPHLPPAEQQPAVVLVSGVVCEKKGQLDFLRKVAPPLVAAGIEVWFSGDFDPANDAYAGACANAAEPLGEKVRFLGYRNDLPDLLRRAQVVAVSSRNEGLMRTMIEAMACGRPVVSTAVASAREMLEQPGCEAGVVIDHREPERMAEAILRLCNDPAERRRMGANGAAIARRLFDAARVVETYEACYDRLLAQAQSPRQ